MNNPIGVFDSGVGGLTVLKSLIKAFPNERFVYLGDTARVPYGNKSSETIERYAEENSKFLISRGAKIIVVACNTASSVAIKSLREKFKIPIIEVVEPVSKKAFEKSKNKKIGVIGTNRTIKTKAYNASLEKISNEIEVFAAPCPLFVPLVEEGWINHPITVDIAKFYLQELIKYNIDTLILGCTHYPLLKNVIQDIVGNGVRLVESGNSVAGVIKDCINKLKINNSGENKKNQNEYYVTDDKEGFNKLARIFMSDESVKAVKCLLC
jgi:glutamate racemase